MTTRGGKSTWEPPFPQDTGTRRKAVSASHADAEEEEQEEAIDTNTIAAQEDPVEPPRTSQDYPDTYVLPFSEWIRKLVAENNSASSSR